MIKVLMVGNHESVKGGITTVINQFKEFDWQKNNIEFKFISTYIDKSNIIKILFFIIAYIRIFLYCILIKPDIIHVHMSYKGSFTRAYYIQKLAIKFRIKNIIHLHGSEFKKWYDSVDDIKKKKIKKLLISSNIFIVLGDRWSKVIKEIEPKSNVVILNNSVNIPNKKTKYNSKKTLLFLGVLIKRKGIHDLIEALYKLDGENYQLLIAGTGEEESNLKELVNRYNLNDKVKFLGWIGSKEKEELLVKSQFMILPSYNEGLPMSILEAMSYGVPVISTNVGDIPSVIANNENGFLFEPGDIDELLKLLDLIIKLKKNEWNNLSNNSIEICETKFSNNIFFKMVIDIYKDL
ncbi:MAG: glycosyltransferase family 4 protein [Bacilli bacterium]|nr:glycosyltransferase family 4 protein [Bacilli bacterium]